MLQNSRFQIFLKNLNTSQAVQHCASIQPLAATAQFRHIFLSNLRPDTLAALSQFMKCNEIASVSIRNESSSDFEPYVKDFFIKNHSIVQQVIATKHRNVQNKQTDTRYTTSSRLVHNFSIIDKK